MSNFDPPIQNLGAIDVISKLRDGSVFLFIACSAPLDNSLNTLSRLQKKVGGYLNEIPTEAFRREIGPFHGKSVRIVIVCEYSISTLAAGMIQSLAQTAQQQGVELTQAKSIEAAVCW